MTKTEYPALNLTVWRETLENGLQVLVVPRPGFVRKFASLSVDFGSMHRHFWLDGQEYTAPEGVAHFLEHKMFDLPGRDVSAEFAAMGASENAYTSYDCTAYYFSCTNHFPECLELLLTFVTTPYFTAESVAKEQGIIGQEIAMNVDSPDSRVFENLMGAMCRSHPLKEPILGTAETIAQITPEVLYRCHRAFYTPANLTLCVSGDVEPEEVAAIARETLGTQRHSIGRKDTQWPEEPTCREPLVRDKMEVAMPTFELVFKCPAVGTGEEGARQAVVGSFAAEALVGEPTELYRRLYEQGLIDSSFGGGFETVQGMSMLLCDGDSENPEAVRDAILARAGELAKTGIPESELARIRRSVWGRRMMELDSVTATCTRLAACQRMGADYLRFPQFYAQVTGEDVRRFLEAYVTPQRCALSIVEPLK